MSQDINVTVEDAYPINVEITEIVGAAGSTGVSIVIGNGSNVPSTGSKGFVVGVPYDCTITGWYITADRSGSCVIDVKRSGTSIVGTGNKPTLSSAQRNHATSSGWTSVAVARYDELEFNLDSASTVQRISLTIEVTKT